MFNEYIPGLVLDKSRSTRMMEHVLATGAEEAKVAEVLARGLLEIIIGTGDEDLEVASVFSLIQRDFRVDRLAP